MRYQQTHLSKLYIDKEEKSEDGSLNNRNP